MDAFPVVVVGAGPVGLSVALGLAHQGVRSVLLEKKEALSTHSKALGILTRTLEIFRAWGVHERFLTEGCFLSRISLWAAGKQEPQAVIDLGSLARLSAVPGLLILPQDRTEALLLEQVTERALTDVRFGHEVAGFHQDETGVVVRIAPDGDEPYELRGSYLVACDGPHSTVREQLGWKLEGRTYPTRMLLVDVRLEGAYEALPWPRVAPQRRGVLAAIRFKPGHWRVLSTIAPDESEEQALGEVALTRRVERLFGPGSFERLWASTFPIHCRTSPHFRQGRVLLAGDAAHINSPAGGQGMNSGIQDAHNLAWKLARCLAGGDTEALLVSYEQERRAAVTENVDRFTDFLTRFVLLPGPPLRTLFLNVARLALASPAVMHRIAIRAGMLDTRYESSTLLSGRGCCVGARAPDGDLMDSKGQRCRLLDLAGRRAALLLFDDRRLPGWNRSEIEALVADVPDLAVVRIVPAAAAPEPDDGLRDATGQLWKAWDATGGMAALIRPDGHVGWQAQRPTVEALRAGVKRALGAT